MLNCFLFSYINFSFLIYTLSKNINTKRNGHSEYNNLALIVGTILQEADLTHININNRILNVFEKKINTLLTKAKQANKRGGRHAKTFIESLKNGKSYSLKIFYNEISGLNMKQEYDCIKEEKRKLENDLTLETTKRLCVEEKLKVALDKNKRQKDYYKRKFKQLALSACRSKNGKGNKGRGLDKNKTFEDYTKRHQNSILQNAKEECQAALSFLGLYDHIATKVEVLNVETNNYETFSLINDDELEHFDISNQDVSESDLDNLNMWLYLKDKFQISHEAWGELSKSAKGMPNLYQIAKQTKKLNGRWNLRSTPGEMEGVQISFVESLGENVRRLKCSGVINQGDTIKIKLSGDGTNIGKRLKIENITYTILNENNVAMSEKGNYMLAIIKMKETYENLRSSLGDLIAEMHNLNEQLIIAHIN